MKLCHHIGAVPPVHRGQGAGSALGCRGAWGGYLASISSGVAVHLVVRVVVTAFESALPDTTDSADSRDTHSNHILTRVPVCKGVKSSTVNMDERESQLRVSKGPKRIMNE